MADEEIGTSATVMGTPSLPGSFGDGRYVPKKLLGKGGQKIVYLVEDTKLGRSCALSLIADPWIDPGTRERFEREARAMARLGSHANVVAVFDLGEDAGRPFIVSELVSGGDLREALRDGPLPAERVIAIARDVLEALAFVHQHGLVHRDIKPGNVWLTAEGRAKVGDFGIALVGDLPRLSGTSALLGTPAYMAPEQLQGERVDGRADLYSLGAMLHELATGRLVFEGVPLSMLSQHLYAQPTPASEIEPSVPKGLESFILRLLAKTPEARPANAEAARAELERACAGGAPAPAPPDPLRALYHAGFVGRRAEITALKAAFERAIGGQPSLQLLAGEPGMGKTRLAQELALHARMRGARVAIGRCSEAEGTPPYLPFSDAIESVLATEATATLRVRLGDDASTLRELLPRSIARLGNAARDDARIDRFQLFEAFAGVLRGIANSHGLLLVLEDLHWADKPSLLLIKHLIENLGTAQLLVVATYRDVEVGRKHPLSGVLAELRTSPAVHRVALRGLALEDVRELLAAVCDPTESADLAGRLCTRTEGNPLFVQEVLKQLVETGGVADMRRPSELAIPEGIRDVIGQRLSRLSERCNRMLSRAAVIGATFSWEVLAAVADEDEDALLDLLDEALASHIVREKQHGARTSFEFNHTLIRETLYDELSTPRRVRVHRQVGEAMERVYRTSIDAHVVDLAHHFFRSNTPDKAIDYSTRAGDRAVLQVGYEEAVEHYARALEMVDALDVADDVRAARRSDLHARRARASVMISAYEGARSDFVRAIALASSDDQRGELLVEQVSVMQFMFDVAAVARTADEILAFARKLGRVELEAAGRAWRGVALNADGDPTQAIAELTRAMELGAGRGAFFALAHLPLAQYWVGQFREAVASSIRIIELSRAANDVNATLLTLPHQALAYASLGRYGEAFATFREAREYGERHGNRALVARVLSMCGGTHLALFDYESAEALAQAARATAGPISFMPPFISSGFDLVVIALRRGDVTRARTVLAELAKPCETAGSWHGWIWRMRLDELNAEIALVAGELEPAIDAATRALERAIEGSRPRYRVWARCVRAIARSRLARDIGDDLDLALADARATGEPVLMLHASRACAAVRPDDRLADEARALVDAIAATITDAAARARFVERAGEPLPA